MAELGIAVGSGHTRILSGSVMWCMSCGSYASNRAVGLAAPCPGVPPKTSFRHWQLRRLRSGIHPSSGEELQPPLREDGAVYSGAYSKLGRTQGIQLQQQQPPGGSSSSSSSSSSSGCSGCSGTWGSGGGACAARPTAPTSASVRAADLLGRIRAKEAAAKQPRDDGTHACSAGIRPGRDAAINAAAPAPASAAVVASRLPHLSRPRQASLIV